MVRKTKKTKITKDVNLRKLVKEYSQLNKVLTEDYDLHCLGCPLAGMETLEMGAIGHGFDDKGIKKMVKRLNKIITIDGILYEYEKCLCISKE